MAELIATIHHYTGTSAEEKPTSGVRKGSLFYERDTGRTYRLSNELAWNVDLSVSLSAGLFITEIDKLRRLLESIHLELQAANAANDVEVS